MSQTVSNHCTFQPTSCELSHRTFTKVSSYQEKYVIQQLNLLRKHLNLENMLSLTHQLHPLPHPISRLIVFNAQFQEWYPDPITSTSDTPSLCLLSHLKTGKKAVRSIPSPHNSHLISVHTHPMALLPACLDLGPAFLLCVT